MPLCITGMHRSGTSMVTRLLNLCGLNMGPASDLLRPRPSNPEGFWENRRFLRVNDAVLHALGGTWDRPPRGLPPSWEKLPQLEGTARGAARLLRWFRGREPWGWKDPRNSLTLPFWRRLVPNLRLLICVRNPLAAAHSLHARDGLSLASALELWLIYNRRVLAAAPAGERLITHYGCYFVRPHAELRRVLKFVGIEASSRDASRACSSIAPSLAHYRMTVESLAGSGVPREVEECYRDLCVEAGFDDASPSDPASRTGEAIWSATHGGRTSDVLALVNSGSE